ncbi:MAG: hypothetical protein HY585_04980 [Candidatus Omnitrophica bacterium]|nr:hypothetical protein [Candidatus Omnitrophota bacterium]
MNHFVVSAFVVFLCALGAGIYFVWRQRSKAEWYFGLFWFSVAFWTLFVSAQFHLFKWISGFTWGWYLHLGCIFVPVLFLHFALHLTNHHKDYALVMKLAYGIATLFILLNTFTDWFTQETIYRDRYAYPKPAVLYPLYILFFQVIGFWTAFLLFKWSHTLPAKSRKLLYLFLTVHTMAYIGSMDNYLIMYDIRIPTLYPYGLYLILPYVFFGSYAIRCLATKRLNASDSAS